MKLLCEEEIWAVYVSVSVVLVRLDYHGLQTPRWHDPGQSIVFF